MPQILVNKLDRYMDFFYGYLILKAYIFKLRFNEDYFNLDYLAKWKEYFEETNFGDLIHVACCYMEEEVDGKILDIAEVMERASYFAMIHPDHPNITLGFVKDADLWNLWLENGIYKYARKIISEICRIGNGDKVLDFGCGSASPHFYSELVGEYGFYAGIDYSRPLLRIAKLNCKEKSLVDRVRLIQGFAESKIEFTRGYDIAVISSILEYTDVRAVMRNAINALGGEGKIVLFSELFRDIESEREKLFELYFSLIPNFRRFPAVDELAHYLDSSDISYRLKIHGKHFVVIDVSR